MRHALQHVFTGVMHEFVDCKYFVISQAFARAAGRAPASQRDEASRDAAFIALRAFA